MFISFVQSIFKSREFIKESSAANHPESSCLKAVSNFLTIIGKALNAVASPNVKVMVVGNPCNTNALICMKNTPNIPAKNFHALTRLDENRAKWQLALKAGVFYEKVSNVTIWGNHSTTQVPDFLNARINVVPVKEVIKDHKWLEEEFTE